MRSVSGFLSDPALGFPTTFNAGDGVRDRYNDTSAIVPVFPRPLAGERTYGIICTGQSVLANWGPADLYTPVSDRSHQGNILDGLVYPITDPVLGCDGTTSSPASAIGDKLIDADKADRVTMVHCGWGSTSSAQWADWNGTLLRGLYVAYLMLIAHGYTNIIHLHQQGERDTVDGYNAGTTQAAAQAAFLANLRSTVGFKKARGIACPMYVAKATFWSGGPWITTDPDPANWTPGPGATGIRAACDAIVDNVDVFEGPDIDAIHDNISRGLNTHWISLTGVLNCSDAWVAKIPALS